MIAFFDLDRTLLEVNSGGLWVKSEYREGYINRWQLGRALFDLVRYHLGIANLEMTLRRAIEFHKGVSGQSLRLRTERFYESEVAGRYRPGALVAVEHHRARGDQLVLLTTSSKYLGDCVKLAVGLDGVLATDFELDGEGCLTGVPIEPLCFGPGKLVAASRYADEMNVSLSECTFYTDSFADRSVMEAVGHPVAVHPDPRLARLARRHGWPIVSWD